MTAYPCRVRWSRLTLWILAGATAGGLTACKRADRPSVPATSQPAAAPEAGQTQPAAAATAPASAPAATQAASLPATQPVSTYVSRPPYPVNLYVRSPADPQPGWLKILKLADGQTPATCTGLFPEKNIIEVQTTNVTRLRLHGGHLPLAERKRIALRIDHQGFELAHKSRSFVILERSPAGAWRIAGSQD